MGSRFSLSGSELAEHCVHPYVEGVVWPRVALQTDARLQQAFHWVAAQVINEPPQDNLINRACEKFEMDPKVFGPKLAAMRPVQHASALVERYPMSAQAEVAYAYDFETGDVRILGQDIGRQYILGATEFGSTNDAQWIYDDPDHGLVLAMRDWKCGPRALQRVPRVRGNRQVHGGAFLASRAAEIAAARQHEEAGLPGPPPKGGPDWIRLEIAFILDDGEMILDAYECSPDDLVETETWLQDIWSRIRKREQPHPGLHCSENYCPILGTCPETQAALAIIDAQSPDDPARSQPVIDEQPAPLVVLNKAMFKNTEHCIWALHRAKAAGKVIEQIIQACQDYSDDLPDQKLPLSNGKFYGPGKVRVPSVIGKGPDGFATLLDALVEETGPELATTLIFSTVKNGDLKEACGSVGKYGTIIKALDGRGLIEWITKIEHRERKG